MRWFIAMITIVVFSIVFSVCMLKIEGYEAFSEVGKLGDFEDYILIVILPIIISILLGVFWPVTIPFAIVCFVIYLIIKKLLWDKKF